MPAFTRRSSRLATWIAVPAAIVAAGVVVSTSSYAAFSSTTANEGNTWESGTVRLSDDDDGRALFSAVDAKPGDGGENCITVTSTGSLASNVRLYATDAAPAGGLADHLTLVIQSGTGGGFGSCDGFAAQDGLFEGTLSSLVSARTSFADGIPVWSPAGGGEESRTVRFAWVLDESTPNELQGASTGTTFVWEAQND